MPPSKVTNTARRKGPSFNPPRPVKPGAQSTTSAKRPAGAAASRATSGAKATASRPGFRSAAVAISSDEEQEEDDGNAVSDDDEQMEDASEDDGRGRRTPLPTFTSPVPATLLARLLHEHFEDDKTQIQKGAMNLFEHYMSVFVREAIARARDGRNKAVGRGGPSDGFLQVEDLEKLAPQLVLDF